MWQRGVAKLIAIVREGVIVLCPFCKKEHTHSRQSLGSKEVMAGCHAGYTRCMSYAIPARRSR